MNKQKKLKELENERNFRRSSEVDKLQRGLECVTKSVEVSKIRIYFQRKKCKQK